MSWRLKSPTRGLFVQLFIYVNAKENIKATVTGGFSSQWARNAESVSMLWSHHDHALGLLSGVPDYFGRNKISSGGDLSHYSSASLY